MGTKVKYRATFEVELEMPEGVTPENFLLECDENTELESEFLANPLVTNLFDATTRKLLASSNE